MLRLHRFRAKMWSIEDAPCGLDLQVSSGNVRQFMFQDFF